MQRPDAKVERVPLENVLSAALLCALFSAVPDLYGFAELLACHWQEDCVLVHAFLRVLVSLLIFLESSVFKTAENEKHTQGKNTVITTVESRVF